MCWNEKLVTRATTQHDPAAFDAPEKVKHNGEITMKEMAEFLLKYLSSDALGPLSNRHLVCCDSNGPMDPESLMLARAIADAVDFPKTGVLPQVPGDIKQDQYPDFMENKHKPSYESESTIGSMYRQMRDSYNVHISSMEGIEEQHSTTIHPDSLARGFERYLDDANENYRYYCSRMNTMLSIYNLESEYELIAGCHLCAEEERQNNDSVETASLEFRRLLHEMRDRFARDKLG